jgi:hypothetical protein
MDLLEKAIDKLKGLLRKLIEALLGSEEQPEPELIPIPVRDRNICG